MAEHRVAPFTDPDRGGKPLPITLKPGDPSARPRHPREGALLNPRFLQRRHRAHVLTFARFVQMAHGVADDPLLEPEAKLHHVDALEKSLVEGRAKRPYLKVGLELREALVGLGIGDRHARQVLQAVRKDAVGQVCRSWSDLLLYCRYAAAPGGRFVLELHGENTSASAPAADALCAAVHILGTVRDCRSDWTELGRCYIPVQWFDEAGVSVERLVERSSDAAVRAVFDRMLRQVDGLLDRSAPLPALLKDRGLRAEARAQLLEAQALRRRLGRADPLARRVQLSAGQRLVVHAKGWLTTFARA
jgi:phytoene/squalene synthetase